MKKTLLFLFISVCLFAEQPVRVYVDVVGDLFHAGHIEFFKKAREFGDYLIVGVIGDELVTDYKRKPVLSHDERLAMIESCKYVDAVYPHCPLGVTDALLDELDVDVVVHGDDFDEATAQEQYHPAIKRGIFRLVPYTSGISTTDIIERIIDRYEEAPHHLAKKEPLK